MIGTHASAPNPNLGMPLAAVAGRVIPSTRVLDRQHRVAAVYLKALPAEDLEPVVERIAREP